MALILSKNDPISSRISNLRMLSVSSGRLGGGGHGEPLKPRTQEEITKWVEKEMEGV